MERIRLPSRRAVLRGGAIVVALILAAGVARALAVFPFEPTLSPIRLGVALGAAGLFFGGAVLLMLAWTLVWRMVGAQAMAFSVAAMLIALAGDGVAWLVAVSGWLVAIGMSAWGLRLAGEISPRRAGRGEESGE